MSKLQANQYLGNGFSAYGGELEVLLTYQDNKIQDLQVTKHHESEMGQWALDELPGKIIAANSADVDGITGATATSRAIKDATTDALNKAQRQK
ncbi:FMN-binding protein [Limosilactobacillus sp. BG-MG3-A]|uniref:FMN-binding protein n=1 Tax=Limosilactobacillus agrestis TaxID=2759748 RepID=A0A7W3YKY8_9LACO|nr:FMN-binding protein [Limosilactobacillus agrestis]MBD5091583.1 FMN-binding protein [Lactobacillus sp.]MBB1094667.1 FMN-binding protein [Limosilactobacillus agrestis]MBB1098868.1 FMN-binding protein [Limosilactobacillus agrestis]MCD7112272.1 FMN-binding protein [Limosilactobacillus agrestis]MCD7119704.1 FMN-binding protein [Limosilactobacillus agrestis]